MAITSASELVADVEARIVTGHLEAGDRLPSVRSVAQDLGLAPNTVAAAYRRLRERGVVFGRGRQGTTIASRTPVMAEPSAPLPSGIVDAMAGNPDPRHLPNLAAALAAAAVGPPARYGDQMVLADLDRSGRRWLGDDGIDVTHFTVTSGAMDAVERVLVEHLRPGDPVGVEDPGHSPVHELVSAMGFEAVPIDIDPDGVRPASLEAALADGVIAVIVTPRAQNPTGAAFTTARAREVNRVLKDHPAVLVIEDDHAGPVAGVPLAALDRNRPNWALIRAVSKSLDPDLRIAFLVGDERTVRRVEARLALGPGWVSHLLQRAVAHLLDDPATETTIAGAARRYGELRELLIRRLELAGIAATGRSGLQVWIPVPAEQPIADSLRAAGYALRVGAPYRRNSPPAVRVTVAGLDDSQINDIAEALIAILRPRPVATSRLV